MARILWMCPVIPGRPGVTGPRVVKLLDNNSPDPHVSSWDTTPSSRAAPYAVGCSEVNVAQLAILLADTEVIIFADTEWDRQFDQQLVATRTRVNSFLTTIGVTRPVSNEVIRDLLSRMTLLLNIQRVEAHISNVDARISTV